jgi:hypothetical protein
MSTDDILDILANPRNKVIILIITAIIAFYVIYSGDSSASPEGGLLDSLKSMALPVLSAAAVNDVVPAVDMTNVELLAPF